MHALSLLSLAFFSPIIISVGENAIFCNQFRKIIINSINSRDNRNSNTINPQLMIGIDWLIDWLFPNTDHHKLIVSFFIPHSSVTLVIRYTFIFHLCAPQGHKNTITLVCSIVCSSMMRRGKVIFERKKGENKIIIIVVIIIKLIITLYIVNIQRSINLRGQSKNMCHYLAY